MAAAQTTRFIDVTRTFIPVNPNSFPDGLHEYTRTDIEDRIPVMAYKGYNFLPTAYGYKSYFGTNQLLGIDALPEQIDRIFTFQNNSFENILIALCDSGIWYKAADVSGAWTQALAMPFDRLTQVHYSWSFTIINDQLYVYRQGFASYQKIVSNASAPGFTLTSVVPTFLNMEAQMGIFRAGNRLGFWDSSDSIAWSNLDDFQDFVPSLETLAGSTVFSAVVGRIVMIYPHGDGFMIYATRSIIYIQEQPESLFQWKPKIVVIGAGIAYREEAVAAIPDDIHYVNSTIGMYKITNAAAEIIIPEVTDYFKEAVGPKYLSLQEGRYLCIRTLDPNYSDGQAQFSDEVIPETVITFPGANLNVFDAIDKAQTQGGSGFCPVFNGLSSGAYQQPEDGDPSKLYRPVYTAYLSDSGARAADNITWVSVPCTAPQWPSGAPYPMSPGADGSLDRASTDATNKRVVAGSDAYVVGGWTIERFVAAQTAIWQLEDAALKAYLSAILGRAHSSQVQRYEIASVTTTANYDCDLGDFVTKYTGPQFGWSPCEFWLTRYAVGAINIRMRGSLTERSVFEPAHIVPYDDGPTTWLASGSGGSTNVGTDAIATITARWNADFPATPIPSGTHDIRITATNSLGQPITYQVFGTAGNTPTVVSASILTVCPVDATVTGAGVCTIPDRYLVTKATNVYNVGINKSIPPTPDTGFCRLTGWDDGTSILPAGTCTAPAQFPDGSDVRQAPMGNPVAIGDDGTFCSQPFEPFIIPGTPDVTINWPDQSVTIPSGTFFLQDGSVEPYYPIFEGAFVYDLHLKKWGKYNGRHRQLLDYSPINTFGPSEQSYARFGIFGGIVEEGGTLRLFDEYPVDSYITYGKVGYYRQGMSTVEEIRLHMKTPCTGFLSVYSSLEGKNLSSGFSKVEPFTDSDNITLYGGPTAKWHNIEIRGRFDISYLEYRGIIQGKR